MSISSEAEELYGPSMFNAVLYYKIQSTSISHQTVINSVRSATHAQNHPL